MIQDTGNFNYLTEELNVEEVDNSLEGFEAYKFLANKRINKWGVGKTYMKFLRLRKRYLIMMNKAILDKDDHLKWKANRVNKEIQDFFNAETNVKREDGLIKIGKFVYNKPISAMEITLEQYDSNMDYLERLLKEQSRQNAKANG